MIVISTLYFRNNQIQNENSESNENSSSEPIEIDRFVLISDIDSDILIDLRYTTTNNFTGKVVYPVNAAVLRKETALKLATANTVLKSMGYKLKVWDAYRPLSVQQIFWDLVHDSKYVANPTTGGSIHNRGCAIDVTLVDMNNNDIIMPSDFDDFTIKASRNNLSVSSEAKTNMNLLTNAMIESGFSTINSEWWHYNDIDYNNYNVTDMDLNLFIIK
jgi:D-alanyl-D-alanine dipeptidase